MKVLLIGSFPKSLVNFRKELILEIKKRKHTILTSAGNTDNETEKELENLDIKFKPYKISRHSINLINNLVSFYQIYQIIKSFKPDVVISYTIKPVIFISLISKLYNFRNFPMITGLGYVFISKKLFVKIFLKKLVSFLYKIGLTNAEKIFFQNYDDLNYFLQNNIISKKNYTVNTFGSGVNLKHFYYSKMSTDKHSFLMISRLLPEKGIFEYLNAVKKLKINYNKMEFTLVGNYEDNHPKNKAINQLIRESKVNYIKYKKDIRPLIEKHNVIVLPSYREGMPRTLLEGMAMGKAIITTDVPGCKETVKNGYNGYLIKQGDVKDLEKAILKICDFVKLKKMGKNSRTIAEKKFDVNFVNDLIVNEIGL